LNSDPQVKSSIPPTKNDYEKYKCIMRVKEKKKGVDKKWQLGQIGN
jgi:hypothetical protein